jgi:molybdopterin converting factor small subunit
MVNVTIVFLARAGEAVGKHLVRLSIKRDNPSLKDLIDEIGRSISSGFYRGVMSGRLVFTIFVNGKPVSEWNYRIRDGDRIVFTTPEMGG